MSADFLRAGKVLLCLVFCITPFIVHFSLETGHGRAVAAAMSGVDITVMGTIFALKVSEKWRAATGAVIVLSLLGLAIWWRDSQQDFLVTSGIPHAAIYVGLLILFGRSLAPNRQALITSVAMTIYKRGLPPEIAEYTRSVTIAWCVFFVLQLLVSLLLFVFAPVQVWSLFVNILNLPLLGLMFGCEYAYRRWRLPNRPQSSLSGVAHAFMQSAAHGMNGVGPDYKIL